MNEKELWIVQPLIECGSLGSLLDAKSKQGTLSEELAVSLFYQIIKGLDYFHSKHLVHGDLNPRHILLDKDGTVMLSSFS